MDKKIEVTRIFTAPVELVWNLWVEPELVKRWWGPKEFTSAVAIIDFRVGAKSIVSMKAPKEMGGQEWFSTWEYLAIIPHERIEFIQALSDASGDKADPVTLGMPADFPKEYKTVVTFLEHAPGKTAMSVTQYADMGMMTYFAQLGLQQSLDKMALSLQ